MTFKKGMGWTACHDEDQGRYFVEYGGTQSYSLFEITEEMWQKLDEKMDEGDVVSVVYDEGRHLYMSVNDRCGPPYTIVFDDDYQTLCPWAKVMGGDRVWSEELTDAAVEIFDSEKNNREQRRKKRAERAKKQKESTMRDVTKRFLDYVAYPTMSDEASETCPSTEKQFALARHIEAELNELGFANVRLDEHCYLYAELPATPGCEQAPAIGLIAHMDTSDAAADSPIQPKVVEYAGGDIPLDGGEVLSPKDYPYLNDLVGQTLIVTDGSTLLGGDDKAGVAEIVTAAAELKASGAPHGKVCIGFTPDEEIGRGADLFDVAGFGADYAYTVDGGPLGELEFENFNAAAAHVEVKGVSIHPGAAKDKMQNAARIASEFDSLLPPDEIPERTEGYEGFHHLIEMQGSCEHATLDYIIRDHSAEKFAEKQQVFREAAEEINRRYGKNGPVLTLTLKESYRNMREQIEPHMYVIDRVKDAMAALGVEPRIHPIRGGTDGARLSYMGLPCPNLGTGGYNAHSRFEFVSATQMEQIVVLLKRILTDAAKLA